MAAVKKHCGATRLSSSKSGFPACKKKSRLQSLHHNIARFHTDDRGNLGVLLLLTLWALVALIGVVWNSGEYATRKQHVQAAADSAAHAGNLWVSRTTNLTDSTNMLMAENGCAEVILRAVPPTANTISERFQSERKRAHLLEDGNQPNQPERSIPDCEYFEELLGFGGWSGNGQGDTILKEFSALVPDVQRAMQIVLPLLSGPQRAKLAKEIPERIAENNTALQWLVGTYAAGARADVEPWIEQQVRTRLDDILRTLDEEQTWLDRWVDQTAPAVQGTTPEQLRDNREQVFEYQQQIRDLTPAVVEEQRSRMASFYKVDLTIATPGNPASDGAAEVKAPVQEADEPESQTIQDSIRERYPEAAAKRFPDMSDPITVTVDPINVNVRDAVIWHPGVGVSAPSGITLDGKSFTGHYHVSGGEWGKLPCAPLLRYFNDRLSRDEQGLRTEPQRIDSIRDDLRGRIYPPPPPPDIQPVNVAAKAAGIKIPPGAIPQLPIPATLSAADKQFVESVNQRISQFNADVRRYISELRGLLDSLPRMFKNLTSLADRASTRFADATWLGYVEHYRYLVLLEMGDDKQFMVLKTYALDNVPDWAKSGMHDSIHDYVYRRVYAHNIAGITRAIRDQLEQWAFPILNGKGKGKGGKGSTGNARQGAKTFANANASAIAREIVQRAAEQIAQEVAQEWIRRPWPFEIAPPTDPAPPVQGLTDDDRHQYFTFLTASKSTDDTNPKPFFSKLFGDGKTMTAFAQGENFNWMEYDERYGAGDGYDTISHYGHDTVGGSPRPWRLSTNGGWTWQPRLALSDALGEAIEDGPEFRSFLEQGGVEGYDPDAIKTMTLH